MERIVLVMVMVVYILGSIGLTLVVAYVMKNARSDFKAAKRAVADYLQEVTSDVPPDDKKHELLEELNDQVRKLHRSPFRNEKRRNGTDHGDE